MPHCKIIIADEVNCKIADLDLDTRKRLVAKFKYEVPYARYLPAVRLGRWDGKVPYFNLGGTTYINLLPEIIEWLVERNAEAIHVVFAHGLPEEWIRRERYRCR